MRILGLDTATRSTAVALLDTETSVALERRDDPPAGTRPRHTTRLLALTESVLDAGAIGWEQVDLIAAGVGPGTFTGLRIGLATARALAGARGIPIVGVSTLRSLAHGASRAAAEQGRSVLAVLDARRAEVFAAGWRLAGPEELVDEPLLAPRALAPEALVAVLDDLAGSWLAVGDGSVEFREALERSRDGRVLIPGDGSELHRVSAIDHCRLAMGLAHQNPHDVRPEYLRLPDAELTLRASGGSGRSGREGHP